MSQKVIVCVDDEKIVLDSLKIQLRSILGDQYCYEIAENAEEALLIIDELLDESFQVLCVISDYLMPGMRGDEFLIRLHRSHPEIKKVMLSGHLDEKTVQKIQQEANLIGCMKKPWTQKELARTLKLGL